MTNQDCKRAEIIVLGCGQSIRDLTPGQVQHINQCQQVYMLNKFAAFFYLTGIKPRAVWFTDTHPPSDRVLQYIFDVISKHKIEGVRFILNSHQSSKLNNFIRKVVVWTFGGQPDRLLRNRFLVGCQRLLQRIPGFPSQYTTRRQQALPPGCEAEYVKIDLKNWRTGGKWAASLDEPLYQYLTSLTALLNYLCIRHPGTAVRLVGVDFNSPGYFFDEEMARLELKWDDWTTALQRAAKKHSAALNMTGEGTLFDKMPLILQHIQAAGIHLTCANPQSELVSRGFVDFQAVPEAAPLPAETAAERVPASERLDRSENRRNPAGCGKPDEV